MHHHAHKLSSVLTYQLHGHLRCDVMLSAVQNLKHTGMQI